MSIVTEKKVLTQEELQTLQNIVDETRDIINELGEIEVGKIQLEARKEIAKQKLIDLTNKDIKFQEEIYNIYGKVNINPNTGETSPIE
jgi:ribosomal protein L11